LPEGKRREEKNNRFARESSLLGVRQKGGKGWISIDLYAMTARGETGSQKKEKENDIAASLELHRGKKTNRSILKFITSR